MEEVEADKVHSKRYAVGEQVLILMRDFLGDNQKKAEYLSRITILKKFIEEPKYNLGDKRLKEINTLLETLSATLKKELRKELLTEQIKIILDPSVDINTLPADLLRAHIFSRLSLHELEKYASSSEEARSQVDEYYKFLFAQAKLADDRLFLFQLILKRNEKVIYDFLIQKFPDGKIPHEFFDSIDGFDPLLYLHIHGHQALLYYLYNTMMREYLGREKIKVYDLRTQFLKFSLMILANQAIKMDLCYLCVRYPEAREEAFRGRILAFAVKLKHVDAVTEICYGSGMMHDCINNDDLELAKEIISYGVKPKKSFIKRAIRKQKNNVAKYFVDQIIAHEFAQRVQDGDIFECICKSENIEMLRYLCEKLTGNPDLKNSINLLKQRSGALAYACRWGNVEAVQLLLGLGFSPYICAMDTFQGKVSALEYACNLQDHEAAFQIVNLLVIKYPRLQNLRDHYFFQLFPKLAKNKKLGLFLIEHYQISDAERTKQFYYDNRSDVENFLKQYVEKYPKRKTAKRLLGIIKGTDPSSLTWFEKLHLNTAFFFGTELGWLYRVADKYLDVQHNAEHDTHNGENEPLLPSEVVSTSSSKTVKEQAEVVSTSSSKTVKEQVGWVAYFDQKTPPSTDRRDELNNNNNRVENSPESVQANDAFLESPRPG